MLERLDQIPWADLSHAYGDASDVPELIRDLASPDPARRDGALWALYGNIWHQGTVYEATAYAVPFLIELLTIPAVPDKAGILRLLQVIAYGSSYMDVHQHLDYFRDERQSEEFAEELKLERGWVVAAHDAVVLGTPVFLSLLSDFQTTVRTTAPFVLASCAERNEEIIPVLRTHADQEADPIAKASALFAMALLGAPASRPDVHSYLTAGYQDQTSPPMVRFVAALGVTHLAGTAAFSETIPIFRETINLCSDRFSELPWYDHTTPAVAVSQLLTGHPPTQLAWLMEMLESRNAAYRLSAVREIEEMCRRYRSTAREVVVPLTRLITDADVRTHVAAILPNMGSARQLATPLLTALLNHPEAPVRSLAQTTLEKVQAVRDTYNLKHWLKKPEGNPTVSDCIRALQGEKGTLRTTEAATALEFIGPSATEAVPALSQSLDSNDHWLRVRAARALWKITGNVAAVLPTLWDELKCRPAGLLVLDCLGDMGSAAQEVIPTLRQIIASEVRLVEVGSMNEWIDEDEAFLDAAQRALNRIQADLPDAV